MLIEEIAIKNFRCIRDASMKCDNLTVIVGHNGSGKSTLLKSLDYFYDISAPVTDYDFYNQDTSLIIEIRVFFASLNEEETAEFSTYIQNDKLAITKKIYFEDDKLQQKYFATVQQIPIITELRKLRTLTDRRNKWNELVDQQVLPNIGPVSVRGDTLDELIENYEDQHPELCEWGEQEAQFFGPKNIGGGILDKFSKFVYVPAVKDVMDEMAEKRGTPMYQLLDMIAIRHFQAREDVKQLQTDFENRIKEVYSPENLTEFSSLADDITRTLQIFVPNASLGLTVSDPSLPTLPTPSPTPTLTEDNFEGAIDRKGHGLQRTLIFSLLQHIAVVKPINVDEEEIEADGAGDVLGPDLILAIEEPELYQHPLRARHISNVLLKMTRERGIGLGGNNQVFYTTHSPYFVDLGRFGNLRIFRKPTINDEEVPCSTISQYTLEAASQEMARVTQKPLEEFTPDSFRARAHPVMTNLVNEGFFANSIIIVEGTTEAAALIAISEILNREWLSKGIAVLSADGKNKIDRPVVIFRGFGIPTYFLFDGDNKYKDEKNETRQKAVESNGILLRLANTEVVEFPETTVEDNYACFEDNFETYCQSIIGVEAFSDLRNDIAQKHGYKPSQGIKSFEVVEELILELYKQENTLPVIEEIIEKVEKLLE